MVSLYYRRLEHGYPTPSLGRDGVLNHDDGYVHHRDQLRWVDGAHDAVRWLNDAGYLVFIVTNQAGIARGLYGEEHVDDLHAWMRAELRKVGAHIDDVEFCPYHPEGVVDRYRRHSDLRKPGPGMLLEAARALNLDLGRSIMVGDRITDLQAGENAGAPTVVHVLTGYGDKERPTIAAKLRAETKLLLADSIEGVAKALG